MKLRKNPKSTSLRRGHRPYPAQFDISDPEVLAKMDPKVVRQIFELYAKRYDEHMRSSLASCKEGSVEVILNISISKKYDGYQITYFFKQFMKSTKDSTQKPSSSEVEQFKKDVIEAAKTNPEVAIFLEKNPELK